MLKILAVVASTLIGVSAVGQTIIPAPRKLELRSDGQKLKLSSQWQVLDKSRAFVKELDVVKPLFWKLKGVDLVNGSGGVNNLQLELDKSAKEGVYQLQVTAQGIVLKGSPSGVFYGLNSLVQLITPVNGGVEIACQDIQDSPEFKWRGLHLDVCRHFFSKDYVKRYIDMMAFHKFNTFHWHLTEDQGWRIEIKKYPELTRVGAYRNGTMVGQYRDGKVDNKRYGGFYTQDEIKEVVAYAAQRHVTVVPEIEMPGHAVAAIASYPWLSCRQQPTEVEKIWGVFEDVYCAGNDSVFKFLEDVLDEVCALFPGEYVHVGGDECPKESWKKCPKCQARIKTLGLKDEHELQSYFIQRMEKYLNTKGKKIIGWDEILEGGLAPNAAVMSWRGTEGAIAAAKEGHQTVLTPGSHCYFDHYQGNPLWEPISIGGYTSVQKVYSFDPVPAELGKSKRSMVLGGQANLWSEYILSDEHMDYMVYPRAAAMAEALWLPAEKKNAPEFLKRLDTHMGVLRALGVNVSNSHYQPEFVTNIEDGKPGIAVKPTTHNPFYVEIISSNRAKPSKRIEVAPDSLMLGCTALATEYRWKFISLPGSCTVVFHTGAAFQEKDTLALNFSLASGKKIESRTTVSNNYSKKLMDLVDGITDDKPFYGKRWVGFDTSVVELVVDLGSVESFKTVCLSSHNQAKNNIYPIDEILLSVSADGVVFDAIQTGVSNFDRGNFTLGFIPTKARYLRITGRAKAAPIKGGSILLDEISIN